MAFTLYLVVSNVTDPDLIEPFCREALIEDVLFGDGSSEAPIVLFRGWTHADKIHILHDRSHKALAHTLTLLDKDGAGLIGSKYLMVFLIYLSNLLADLSPSLGVPCIVSLVPHDVVIERASRNLQSLTKRVNAETTV